MKIKDLILNIAAVSMLAGCTSRVMPPFAGVPWVLAGNEVISARHGMAINWGGNSPFPITNMSDGSYDLHFITTNEQFAAYDPVCKRFIEQALGQLPLTIDSMQLVLADQFAVFTPSVDNTWPPDLVRRADGAELVAEANPSSSLVQPHDETWRNLIFDDKRRRLLVVDRLVKNGKHVGILYVMQSDDKRLPFSSTMHYDVTARRNAQPVGEHLRALFDITIAASESQVLRRSYSEYIHAADSCFMLGDCIGASKQFGLAFATGHQAQGTHLYNAACAAALAGDNSQAFARLNARLSQEPEWFVDDPMADTDLQGLHDDTRWAAYADTIIARRDRIEAGYDKPLRARLQEIGQRDQEIRYAFLEAYRATPQDAARIDSLTSEMQRVDSVNQAAIVEILDTRGLVGSDLVGNACAVFWLVIQHAPMELQKKYFPLFEQAARRDDISLESVAMMDDRIAMFEGRPQKYGSQIVDGQLYRLLDPEMVDQWRQEMGMQPLADYLRQMGVAP